jgi:hypothetical protein
VPLFCRINNECSFTIAIKAAPPLISPLVLELGEPDDLSNLNPGLFQPSVKERESPVALGGSSTGPKLESFSESLTSAVEIPDYSKIELTTSSTQYQTSSLVQRQVIPAAAITMPGVFGMVTRGNDILVGDIGNTTVDSSAGNDRIFGEDGNDILSGNAYEFSPILKPSGKSRVYGSTRMNEPRAFPIAKFGDWGLRSLAR